MTTVILLAAAICNAEVCPERQNDFCWENDKFGMRAYGPGEYHKWSGWEVFNKAANAEATCADVLHGRGVNVNWHETPYKGIIDNYTMGASRGVGGIAMFADGEWKTFPNWESCRVITNCDERCEFELVYPAFSAAGKMTCHVTLKKGERFFRNDVSFEKGVRDFWVGPGLDASPERGHAGKSWEDADSGVVALFEDSKGEVKGSTATAIFIDPNNFEGVQLKTDHLGCRILTVNRQKFTYYAGAAWSKAGEIVTPEDWFKTVADFRKDQMIDIQF